MNDPYSNYPAGVNDKIISDEFGGEERMTELFTQALQKGLQRENKTREYFYITDLGKAADGCLRGLWLDFQHVDKAEHGIGKLLMFDHGNRIHETINRYLFESGLFSTLEFEGQCNLEILGEDFHGRYDCMAVVDDEPIIIDYKTVRGAAFEHLIEPKTSHVAQVQAYLMALELRRGYVIYIDREGQNGWRIFEIGRDDDNVKTLATKCIHARYNEPPILEPVFKKDELKTKTNYYVSCPWQCQYCDYYGVSCKGAMPKELDIGKAFAAEEVKGQLVIKAGFEPYFEDMEKFNV